MHRIATDLLEKKDYKKLEHLFASHLKSTTNISLFQIYISYIRQKKQTDPIPVYEFILKKLKHHWDIYPIIKEYIKIVQVSNLLDDEKIEKIRFVFHSFFTTPMNDFKLLWKDYETFESELNKMTAKKLITDVLPVYQKTFKLYLLYKNNVNFEGDIQDSIIFDDFYTVLEIEERNVAGFEENHFNERMEFIFRFFAEKYEKEEVYFFWSELYVKQDRKDDAMRVIKNGIEKIEENNFLYCYYATISNEHLFDKLLLDEIKEQNDVTDLLLINYLSFLLKNEGVESFRSVFKRFFGQEIGPCVFIFVAKAEYFIIKQKEIPFRIFTKALNKYPAHIRLQEEFLNFLLQIGDLINARAFFEQFTKTKKMVDAMLEAEIKYGDNKRFRDLLQFDKNEINDNYHTELKEKERYFTSFKSNLEYCDLKFSKKVDILEPFLRQINDVRNIKYLKIDSQGLIDILKDITIH